MKLKSVALDDESRAIVEDSEFFKCSHLNHSCTDCFFLSQEQKFIQMLALSFQEPYFFKHNGFYLVFIFSVALFVYSAIQQR